MSSYGWLRKGNKLHIVWDSEENLLQVHKTVEYLTKRCKCKTGCNTLRCKCKKESLQCGPSCHCVNCKNTSQYVTQNEEPEQEIQQEIKEVVNKDNSDSEGLTDEESSLDETDRLDELNREVDEMMEEIFGVKF